MIDVELNNNQLREIEKKLGSMSDKSLDVLKKAVNDTAKDARKLLAKEAKKKYVVKTSKFTNAMSLKKATKKKPEAVISAKGKNLEISEFKAAPFEYKTGDERPERIKAKVTKKGKMTALIWKKYNTKAFVVKFSNGHPAIVERNPEKEYTVGKSARRAKYWPKQDMSKIDKILSPSVPYMLGSEEVYGQIVKPFIETRLQENIEKHIEKILTSGGS